MIFSVMALASGMLLALAAARSKERQKIQLLGVPSALRRHQTYSTRFTLSVTRTERSKYFRKLTCNPSRDVGETAAKLLSEEGHLRATYELVGPDCMGYRTVAELISRESGKPVEAKQIPIAAFLEHLPPCADRDYAIDMFERMFTYYNRHGLTGNSNVLSYLLGRPATSYGEYIEHELSA
jgi:hypothetical protein